ncbi:tail protein X [Burkholderia multivorans]|jgi:phage tail protein X|uniref:Tail X family protein n=1 Tax=Burkholderia multivorans TaxID=87883 RepID=A0ABD7L4D8_9BURK|nr:MULTISPECIES: tail protein X [Burkholderia]AJY18428.1 phage Tail Protein X family protein [Burkholderia multivorans ATCC BAA-247]AOJ94324.1 phage tail protein [Burkholderia multivorans]AOK66478.1 phage tail protein [Burkholderia multivorans]AVR20564.1 phage tail protein [Burkholderia multivorans]EED98012.1 phage Tail Protein X [Burkholderia multivorans CGD1]
MWVRALQGETVDALCWRVLGRTRGVVEAVLELNRDLAQYGPILPHGLLVELPDEPPQAAQSGAERLQLWD